MNAILEQINSAGLKFVEFALPMFVQSVVLIAILLLADLVLRKKVRAVFRYGIWLLVLVKLVLPTSLSSPMSLGYFFGDSLTYVDTNEAPAEPQANLVEPEPVNVPTFIDLSNIEADRFAQAPPPPLMSVPEQAKEPVMPVQTIPPAVSVTPLSWQGAVFLVWLTVVMVMTLLLLQRAIFVKGLVAQAKEASVSMADMLESCRSSMLIKRKLGLKISPNAASPAVCGLFRPVILVPQNLTSSLTANQLRAVLLHELAHIRRGDLFVNLAQTVLQIIYFYNPLLWLANCIIRRIREQAVDEMVLVAMGEKAPQYPQTLVSVAKLAFKRPVLSLRLIGVVESKNALSGRIKHILNRPMPKKAKLGILGLVVIIVVGAILLPMAGSMSGSPRLVIKGVVRDARTNEPIAGARVFDDGYANEPLWEQIRPDQSSEWGAITNEAGRYSFLTWPEHHTIKVEAPGYKSQRRSLYKSHFTFNKKDVEIFDFALESEFKPPEMSLKAKPTYATDEPIELYLSWADNGWVQTIDNRAPEKRGKWNLILRVNGVDYSQGEYPILVPEYITAGVVRQGRHFDAREAYSKGKRIEFPPGRYRVSYVFKDVSAARPDEPRKIVHFGDISTNEVEFSVVEGDAVSPSGFKVTLSNRVTVELIGISEHPSEGKQWWRPDGSRLNQRPFEKLAQRIFTKHEYYELALKIENPENKKLNVITKGGKVFNLYSGKIWAGVVLSEGKKMLNQTIGIAHGPWKTIVEAYPKLNQIVGDFAFGEAFESNVEGIGTAVGVTVTHTIGKEKVDYRVIAVDTKGNIHTSSGHSGLGGGSWIQTTVHFKNLRIDDIKEFQFQTRPYDWVTFNNISLKPNFKTDVQTEVMEGSPENKMPTAMIGTWYFDNPGGDDEQMAVFPDGRVVVLYSNGNKDESRYTDGFIELAEYDNARYKMTVETNDTIIQSFDSGGSLLVGRRWKRIDSQPRTNLLRVLTGPNSGKPVAQVKPEIGWVVVDSGRTRLLSDKEKPDIDNWVSIWGVAVKNKGRYLFPDEGLTLKDLIKAAGYNKDKLAESYIELIRRTREGNITMRSTYSRNLKTLLISEESDVLLKPHDTVTVSYVVSSTNGVEFWSGYHFSEIVQMTVNDDGAKVNMFADLDTGKLITPPDTLDFDDENAALRWIKNNGVDVMGETAADVHGLVGFNMYAARVDKYFWDAAPREVTDRLMVRIDDPVLLSVDDLLPVTYLIKTSKYKMGILQILGFVENPKGIKIRYKLLNKEATPKRDMQVGIEPVVGDWQYIGQSIPPDFNDTMILTEHINLGSIGHDAEGKTFITFIRDGQQAQDRQYRFVLFTKDGDILEPDGHLVLGEGKRLEEKFTFDEPFITRYLKGFRFQTRPSPPSGLDNISSQLQNVASEVVKSGRPLPSNLAPPGRYAVELDGLDDYLLVPDSPSLRLEPPFTIEMWIKTKLPPDASEYHGGWALISKGFTVGTPRAYLTGFGINIQRFPNEPSKLSIDFCKANNSGTYSATYAGYPLTNGVSDWIHIHHVFDGQYYKSAPGHPLVMGKFLIPTNDQFKGLLGEVRLWNGARSRQELRQYENVALTGNESGLVACWTFEQTEGRYAYDISGNNNHARLGKFTGPDDADPKWIDLQAPSPEPDLQADDKNSQGEGALMLEGFYSFGEGEMYSRRLSQIFGKAQTYIEQMSAGYENKDWDNVSDASIQVHDIFFNLNQAIEVDDDTAWEAFAKMWNGEKTDADDVRLVDLARLKRTFEIFAFVDGQYHEETHQNLCSSIVNIADMADEIQKALRAKRTTMISSYVEKLHANWAVLVEIEGIKKIFPSGSQTKDKTDLRTDNKKRNTEISGFVIDENGSPIAGVTVTLLNKDLVLLPKPERFGRTMRMIIFDNFYDITDTNGRFEFLDFNPGKTDIIVKSRGYRTEILRGITTGTKNLKVTLGKPSAYWLAGEVVDGDGNPISDVEITLAEESYTTVRTDEKGAFQFAEKLEPTTAHRARMLFARKEGFGIWGKTLDTTGGETYVKITLLPEEKISGRVVDQVDKPIADATVVFWSCRGRDTDFSFTGKWRVVAPRTKTDTDGRFTLTGIPAESDVCIRAMAMSYASSELYCIKTGEFGSYAVRNKDQETIMVYGSNREPQETIEFKLQKAVTLIGTLTYEDSGRPAPGIRIATQSHKASQWAETRTDQAGHFKLEGVSPNPCNLLVVQDHLVKDSLPQWTASAIQFHNLQEGETRSSISLVLTKGGIIRGRAVDAQGNPLHGIDIAFYSAARPRPGAACQSIITAKDGTWAFRFPSGDVYVYIRTTIPEGKWSKKIYNLHIDDGQVIDNIDFVLSNVVPDNSPYRRETAGKADVQVGLKREKKTTCRTSVELMDNFLELARNGDPAAGRLFAESIAPDVARLLEWWGGEIRCREVAEEYQQMRTELLAGLSEQRKQFYKKVRVWSDRGDEITQVGAKAYGRLIKSDRSEKSWIRTLLMRKGQNGAWQIVGLFNHNKIDGNLHAIGDYLNPWSPSIHPAWGDSTEFNIRADDITKGCYIDFDNRKLHRMTSSSNLTREMCVRLGIDGKCGSHEVTGGGGLEGIDLMVRKDGNFTWGLITSLNVQLAPSMWMGLGSGVGGPHFFKTREGNIGVMGVGGNANSYYIKFKMLNPACLDSTSNILKAVQGDPREAAAYFLTGGCCRHCRHGELDVSSVTQRPELVAKVNSHCRGFGRVRLDTVYTTDNMALVATSKSSGDKYRRFVLSITRENNRWLVTDVQIETKEDEGGAMRDFLKEYPDARIVPNAMRVKLTADLNSEQT